MTIEKIDSLSSALVRYDEILSLYDRGRYVTAYNRLLPSGGLDALTGPAGRALAGRLAGNLDAERYGRVIHLRAWRAKPDAETLGFYVALDMGRIRGPIAGLDFIAKIDLDALSTLSRADLLSAKATLLAMLRDFARAEPAINDAIALAPNHAWLQIVRGHVERYQDRTEHAVEAFQAALKLKPCFRPAIQALAEAYTQLNRIEEARALLMDASQRLESGNILVQLAHLERELGEYTAAREHIHAAEALFPLVSRDRLFRQSLAGFKSTLAYDCGDIDGSIELARESGTPYHKALADNMSEHGKTGNRVVLNVGFTLQHAVTCVPATLSTLTNFWNKPLPHLDIAEAICYDGTPAHAEREFLESNGFFCREFTLTWDAAQSLIDAGLPFTITLTGYGMGHMQAVIGYDSRRQVLIIRDPNARVAWEMLAKELLDSMRSSGPRGMVFVPAAERGRVETLSLPDYHLWDAHYVLTRKLDKHDRDGAKQAYEQMVQLAPEHRLTTYGRARMASYDGERAILRECTEKLLAEFPNDQNQWSVKLNLLRENGTRDQRLKVLSELNGKPDCEAVFRHQFVDELLDDPSRRDETRAVLRRLRRSGASDGQTLALNGRLLWLEGKRREGLKWYRYAACVDSKDEARSLGYFYAARVLNRTDEVLQMLRDRWIRFRAQSGAPGRSLAEALDQLNRPQQAVEVLEKSLAARPQDGELLLFAADFLARIGRNEQANEYLMQSQPLCRAVEWRMHAARLAWMQNELEEAWEHVRRCLASDPLKLSTQHLAAEILTERRGSSAAREHLKKYSEQFPEHQGLRGMLVEYSHEAGPDVVEAEAREFLKFHPHDAWAWRELGLSLMTQRRWQEAYDAAQRARAIDPDSEVVYLLFGAVLRGVGKHEKALQAMMRSIELSADYAPALPELIKMCDNLAERREVLGRVFAELKRQVIRGDSLHAFRDHASFTFEPEETLRMMLEARNARPDLWQTWSALVRQFLSMKRLDDALKYAQTAAERFPLLPQTLLDLADVHLELEQPTEERAAIEQALAINSRNAQTLRHSAEAYRRAGDLEQARLALERACASEPRNVTHLGALAEILWLDGRRKEAIDIICTAINREPSYEWAWRQLSIWTRIVGDPDRLVTMTKTITESRPNSPAIWLQRARILSQFPEQYADCQQAIDRAIELDPRSVDAHDLRAIVLADHGDFDAALTACRPPILGARQPLQLATRAAVIERQRGDLSAAIAEMRRVTEQDPHYVYAWSQLASWLQEDGKQDESLQCAKRLTEIQPDSPASWGYLADALIVAGDQDDAIPHLKKSIQLDPSYLFGGRTLLAIQLGKNEHEAALATLRTIGPHLSEDERTTREAQLYCRLGDKRKALQSFQAACRAKSDGAGMLLEAADALLQVGQAANVKELLLRALEQPGHSPQLGRVIVEIFAREGDQASLEELCDSADTASQTSGEIAASYVDVLEEAKATQKWLQLLARRGDLLGKHDVSWAAAGFALQENGFYERAVQWMSDWRDRPELKPHMFTSLAISLIALDETRAAGEVIMQATNLPVVPATDVLRLLGACAQVSEGILAGAQAWLSSIQPSGLPEYYGKLFQIVARACSLCSKLDQGARWKDVHREWSAACSQQVPARPDDFLAHMVSRCERMLVQRRKNVAAQWIAEQRLNIQERKRKKARQARVRSVA